MTSITGAPGLPRVGDPSTGTFQTVVSSAGGAGARGGLSKAIVHGGAPLRGIEPVSHLLAW
ncbi:uncharacterized protein SOCE26_007980 [Sorangium cellulosum]|uniref:Uncharacterized protein n=1 Tax=Sorangium cellulosum TaxID=56 RepID=A0A2L0EJD9_SORCE|nr:hypothetical protein [Sorangium cellulosum]AUX39407.1 uncharacterized protein SOCE26_007980 [Sorangium cellulosum]